MQTIGIIAGRGNLPKLIYRHCKEHNIACYFVFIDCSPNFSLGNNLYCQAGIGQVGKVLSFFKKHCVSDIILAGGVTKPSFSSVKVDFRGVFLLGKILKNTLLGDNVLLTTIIKYLEDHKFNVLAVDDLLPGMHLREGFNNKVRFKDKVLNDIDIGVNVIKQLSKFDIGQSLIVQNGRVIAIEAAEGTDEMIKRSKGYIEDNEKSPAFLVKLIKKNQDRRADLPTIGSETISNILSSGLSGVVLDVNNSLVIDKKNICDFAEDNNIFIYGIVPDYEES